MRIDWWFCAPEMFGSLVEERQSMWNRIRDEDESVCKGTRRFLGLFSAGVAVSVGVRRWERGILAGH